MEELVTRLREVEDSYEDFVGAISQYARKKSSRLKAVLEYMNSNPDANSSDIIYFVSHVRIFKFLHNRSYRRSYKMVLVRECI